MRVQHNTQKKKGLRQAEPDLDSYASCRPGVTKCQTLDFPMPVHIILCSSLAGVKVSTVKCDALFQRAKVADKSGPDWTNWRDGWKLNASDNDVVFIFKMSARLAIGEETSCHCQSVLPAEGAGAGTEAQLISSVVWAASSRGPSHADYHAHYPHQHTDSLTLVIVTSLRHSGLRFVLGLGFGFPFAISVLNNRKSSAESWLLNAPANKRININQSIWNSFSQWHRQRGSDIIQHWQTSQHAFGIIFPGRVRWQHWKSIPWILMLRL